MKKFIKNIISKYIGDIQYVVTIINTTLQCEVLVCKSLKHVDECVQNANTDKYWSVLKIEKIRKFNFKYDKNVIHKPLWENNKNITEYYNIDDHDYRFLKIDESLTNVNRKLNY